MLSESNATIKRRHASRQEDIDNLNLLHPSREKDHLDQIICNTTVLMMLEIGKGILFNKKSIIEFELGVTGRSVKYLQQSINGKASGSNHTTLTKREIDVVKLLCRELTNEEIANKLHIDIRTVHTHRENILKKIKAKNIAGVIKFAFNNKLYP